MCGNTIFGLVVMGQFFYRTYCLINKIFCFVIDLYESENVLGSNKLQMAIPHYVPLWTIDE